MSRLLRPLQLATFLVTAVAAQIVGADVTYLVFVKHRGEPWDYTKPDAIFRSDVSSISGAANKALEDANDLKRELLKDSRVEEVDIRYKTDPTSPNNPVVEKLERKEPTAKTIAKANELRNRLEKDEPNLEKDRTKLEKAREPVDALWNKLVTAIAKGREKTEIDVLKQKYFDAFTKYRRLENSLNLNARIKEFTRDRAELQELDTTLGVSEPYTPPVVRSTSEKQQLKNRNNPTTTKRSEKPKGLAGTTWIGTPTGWIWHFPNEKTMVEIEPAGVTSTVIHRDGVIYIQFDPSTFMDYKVVRRGDQLVVYTSSRRGTVWVWGKPIMTMNRK